MKQQLTNLPQLASNVKVRKMRGQKALVLKFIAPAKVEEEKPAAADSVQSSEYAAHAVEIDAGQAVLEAAFRTIRRPIARPTSAPVAAIVISAKIAKAQPVVNKVPALPVAPKVDYSQKGHLGNTNQGFSLLR